MVIDHGLRFLPADFARLERLDDELEPLLGQIGFGVEGFPHTNKGPEKKKAKTWDDEILSLVYENYREDYDMFGYDPEGNVVDKPDRAGEPPRLDSLKERIDRLDTAAFDPWRVYDLS